MAVSTYFKCKCVKCSNKKTGWPEQIKKHPSTCCLEETHFKLKDWQTESQGMKKEIPCKEKQKESWSSNIVSVKINFKTKSKKTKQKTKKNIT